MPLYLKSSGSGTVTSVTAYGVTVTTSGTLVSTGQTPGTATNDSATAGNVGEFIESVVTNASPVNFTTSGTPQNLTSVSLTAGDWDVSGLITYNPTVAATLAAGGISTTTGTMPAIERQYTNSVASAARASAPLPVVRLSLSGTTIVYAVGDVNFSSGTCAMYGFINARRVR